MFSVSRGAFAALLLLPVLAASIGAQDRIAGLVELDGTGLEGVTVVLHRVSPSEAGEVDSIRAGPLGTFQFELSTPLDDEAGTDIYFASVRHSGVLYFGQAIARKSQLIEVYRIEVFDTEVAPEGGAPLPVAVRNFILEEDTEDDGWRVSDLFQVRNEGDRTLVAAEGGVVWSHPLPDGALDPSLGQGDLSPDAMAIEDGRVVVRAPLPPGERMVMVRYRLAELPAEIPVAGSTLITEMLVREPATLLEAPPLLQAQPVQIEPETYRRYVGENLFGTTIVLAETEEATPVPIGWLAVVLSLMLGAAGLWIFYRPQAVPHPVGLAEASPPAQPAPTDDERRQLLLRIASLDEEIAWLAPDDEKRAALTEERARWMAELRARS